MSVPMALVDYIPVILFLLATLTLMHDLYHMMSKGAFALFSAGSITVFMAGIYKATWKLLYALNVCDFVALNKAFFPMQTTGFVLMGIGIIGLLHFDQGKTLAVAAPVAYTSSMIFVVFMVLGLGASWIGLGRLALKMKKKNVFILLMISFVCMLGMGYLSSKDFSNPMYNWIGEGVNILGMCLLLVSVKMLHKNGLEEFELK